MKWKFPLKNCTGIPVENHPGSFGFKRSWYIHTGVDLYAEDNDSVYAVEDGVVVNILPFTGYKTNSAWWKDTDCILIEGKTGVVCYGEISTILPIGTKVKHGDKVANIKRVIKEGMERPDIIGHKPNMLHIELYPHGRHIASDGFEDYLINPTPFLLESEGRPPNVLSL